MLSSIESKIILALCVLLALAAVAISWEESRIGALNQDIGKVQSSLDSCVLNTAAQNKSIADGVAMQVARESAAQAAIDAAKVDAKLARQQAAKILASKAPAGSNECTLASKEFDAELSAERTPK